MSAKAGKVSTAINWQSTLTESQQQFFWSKIDKTGDGCWPWKSTIDRDGYGQQGFKKKNLRAHRLAWELTHGPIPEGMQVLHVCDVRNCCNVKDHLFLGTDKDNIADMVRKGRQSKGETHGSRTKPECVPRGDRNGMRKHPELLKRGDEHWTRKHPEWLARGDRSGARTHPETRPRGIKNHKAKLTESNVIEIRAIYDAKKATITELGAKYGVSSSAIWFIVTRKSWAHVP